MIQVWAVDEGSGAPPDCEKLFCAGLAFGVSGNVQSYTILPLVASWPRV
jgi:hypothetical protein